MMAKPPPDTKPPMPPSPFDWKPAIVWWVMPMLVALFWTRDLWATSTQVHPIP